MPCCNSDPRRVIFPKFEFSQDVVANVLEHLRSSRDRKASVMKLNDKDLNGTKKERTQSCPAYIVSLRSKFIHELFQASGHIFLFGAAWCLKRTDVAAIRQRPTWSHIDPRGSIF